MSQDDILTNASETLGRALTFRGWFGSSFLHLSDPAALQHVLLTHSYQYPKPDEVRRFLARILGKGILFEEGDAHKRQRRIMGSPFSWANVKGYQPRFQSHANLVRQVHLEALRPDSACSSQSVSNTLSTILKKPALRSAKKTS